MDQNVRFTDLSHLSIGTTNMCAGFLWGKTPSFEMLPIQENYEGRIDGHSNPNSKLFGWGLNIHPSFVSRSSQEKSKI